MTAGALEVVSEHSLDSAGTMDNALVALREAERALDSGDTEPIGMWTWIKDVQALLKVRKAAADIRKQASIVEAKTLRQIGQQSLLDALPKAQRSTARSLAEASDGEFDEFLRYLSGSETTVLGTYRLYSRILRDRETSAGIHRRAEAGESRAWSPLPSGFRGDAVRTLCESLLDSFGPVPTTEIIDSLEDEFGYELKDPVVRAGLNALVINALSSKPSDGEYVVWTGEGRAPLGSGRVPPMVTFQDDYTEEWVRSPWRIASMAQLEFNVKMVEEQARERVEAARSIRSLHTQLLRVLQEMDMPDFDWHTPAAHILQVGLAKGLLSKVTDE